MYAWVQDLRSVDTVQVTSHQKGSKSRFTGTGSLMYVTFHLMLDAPFNSQ